MRRRLLACLFVFTALLIFLVPRPSSGMRFGMGIGIQRPATSSLGYPTTLPGVVLWLRGDEGVATSSGKVTQWNDLSPQGNNATQSTSSIRPSYSTGALNGLPCVQFTAASNTLLSTTNVLAIGGQSEITVFMVTAGITMPASQEVVLELGTSVQDPYGLIYLDTLSTNGLCFEVVNSGSVYTIDYFVPGVSLASANQFNSIFNIGATSPPRATVRYNQNNETLSDSHAGTPTATTWTSYTLNIGARSGGAVGSTMTLCELIVMRGAATASQISGVEAYEVTHWAVP